MSTSILDVDTPSLSLKQNRRRGAVFLFWIIIDYSCVFMWLCQLTVSVSIRLCKTHRDRWNVDKRINKNFKKAHKILVLLTSCYVIVCRSKSHRMHIYAFFIRNSIVWEKIWRIDIIHFVQPFGNRQMRILVVFLLSFQLPQFVVDIVLGTSCWTLQTWLFPWWGGFMKLKRIFHFKFGWNSLEMPSQCFWAAVS